MKWQTTNLGSIVKFSYGKGLPEEKRKDGNVPVYGSSGIIGFHEKALITGPGIIIGRKGNVGSVFFENNNFYPIDTVYYIRDAQESVNLKFLYYLLKNLPLAKLNSDAAVPGLNRERALKIKILRPSLLDQEKIASILSVYDDLIDTNRRRIQLLEESARLLFREWFVYFRFPGHEKVKIVDGMPEGWKKEKINKLVIFKRGVEPGSDNYLENNESGSFPFFRVSDLVTRNPSIFVDEQYAKSALLKKSDIVISLDGSIGIVSMGLEGCYSTGIRKLIIKDKKINRAYLYFLMKSHYVQGIINAYEKVRLFNMRGRLQNT